MASPRIDTSSRNVVRLNDKNGKLPVKSGIESKLFVKPVVEITRAVLDGQPIPEKYYRSSTGLDYMLDQNGWYHLHVGIDIPGQDNVLLIVAVSAHAVIFIGLYDHSIFEETPQGKSIKSQYGSEIAKAKLPPKKTLEPSSKDVPPEQTPTAESSMRSLIDISGRFDRLW